MSNKETNGPVGQQAPSRLSQDLITENHVQAALTSDKGNDAQLLTWSVKDFTTKGDNYACIVTSIAVNYRQGGEEKKVTYVAKCNPCRQMLSFNKFTNVIFQKEAGFYTDLVPLLNDQLKRAGQQPLRVAPCYFFHLEEDEEVIILGDLRPEGYKMFDRKKGMNKAHAVLVLRELGRLHAASILLQHEISEDLGAKYTYLQKDFHSFYEDASADFVKMIGGAFTTAANMAGKIDGYEKVASWLRDFGPKSMDGLAQQLENSPPFDVLCHGDSWNNNILFRYDEQGLPVDVRLLDFQICRKASPATDLNYFMYTSFNGDDRKDNLDVFINTYFDSVKKVMEAGGAGVGFTVQELRQEYHKKNLFGLIMAMMVVPLVVSEGADVMDLDSPIEDMDKFMKEHQEKVSQELDNNPLLRPRLLAIFDDMVEYGIIS
ncbi:uncharacterized protein [Procambarus clarkii]|uniref:uncharacterized protein n=1 Tax=Procambarus clarkii TaxID=6728 RepID=UPI001E6747F6|nr:uncharacterized protein LOC123761718 [Procambarus clarkii]